MHVFHDSFGTDGCVVRVRIGLTDDEVHSRRMAKQPIPQPILLDAILDTGADLSCVDPAALRPFALPTSGLMPTYSPGLGGLALSSQYTVNFAILDPSGAAGTELILADWIVTELDLSLLGHQALIGRDVLSRCVFTFNGPANTFSLTY
jgi:hypothetical protein